MARSDRFAIFLYCLGLLIVCISVGDFNFFEPIGNAIPIAQGSPWRQKVIDAATLNNIPE